MSQQRSRGPRRPWNAVAFHDKHSPRTRVFMLIAMVTILVFVIQLKSTVKHNVYTPDVPRTGAYACPFHYNVSEFALGSQSLNMEEQALHDGYFKRVCGGSYIELGAHDGIGQDNTLSFHIMLDWTGVLIEPSPTRFQQLEENRPDDILIHAAVCASHGKVHFIDYEYVGGIYEFMNPEFREFWHPDVHIESLPTVECSPLEALVVQSNVRSTFFDFLSLDVEGGEYNVLQTLGKLQFGIILVESDGGNPLKDTAVRIYLEEQGYAFDGNHSNSQWFINKKWHHIYGDMLQHSL